MSVEATTGLRILASLLILIPAMVGLVLHSLLAFSLYRGWETFRAVSFYVITVQIQWCDVYALLLNIYVAFPLTLTGNQYMGDSIPLYYGPVLLEGVAFHGLFLFSFVLCLNRFLLFLFPKLHNILFTRRGTMMVSLIVWIYVLLFIGLSSVFGCRKQFNKDEFYFWYNCSNRVPGSFHYIDFMNIQSYAIPCCMIIMYAVIYVKLKLSFYNGIKNETTRGRKEFKYLIQTMLISVLIVIEVAAFITLPFLGVEGYGQFYLDILLNLIIVANNLATPVVLFAFNWDVQKQLFALFSNHRQSTSRVFSHIQKVNQKVMATNGTRE